MKKKKLIILSLCCLLFASFAFAASETKIQSRIRTQGVDIRVYTETEGAFVLPGQRVKYSPVIENAGMPAYIRFKTEAGGLPEAAFYGLDERWIKRGEYFYYTEPLANGEKIMTFEGFKIPKDFQRKDGSLGIAKYCDAVQAENFTPDFDSQAPWGSIAVARSNFDGDTYVSSASEVKPLELDFSGGGRLSISSEDILSFDLAPGAEIDNQIVMKSSADASLSVKFKSEAPDDKLLKAVRLKLYTGETKIYDGDLRAEPFKSYKEIMRVEPGTEKILRYVIDIPAETDNSYGSSESEFNWSFETETLSGSAVTNEAVKTGDVNPIGLYIGIALAAGIGALLILKKRRGMQDGNKSKDNG